ncbi:glycoside hydrolase family 28 protein [bacterium SCSIO 12741]|nr:glycoside hydrolase family 28 protein [bacterium SCSIO 12741]
MIKKHLFFFLIGSLIATSIQGQELNILDFGAVGDGQTLNTKAIQLAVDKAHEQGGGRVVVPAGDFLSGTIILKSNVELHLEKKATILGSTNQDHYQKLNRWKGLIMADSASRIAITGKGTLNGQGAKLAMSIDSLFYIGELDSIDYKFPEMRPKWYLRPQLIEFVNCQHIRVEGITLKNASCWVQSYDRCYHLVIDQIRVESDVYWNNDGMDIVDSRNVQLTNSYFNSGDDGICIKSYKDDLICDSIYIANCTIRSSASAVKLGIAGRGGFTNIVIRDIKVFDTFRSAITIQSVYGGKVEDILVENVVATNTGNAIFLRLGDSKYAHKPPGTLKNVTIRNVKVTVPFERPDYNYQMRGPELAFFHNPFPSSIVGIPGHPIQNITLENIEISYPGRGNKAYAYLPLTRLNSIPEREKHYPEFSMFGELPAWGFYVRHAEGITFKNVVLKIRDVDYRPAIVFDDVKNSELKGVEIKGDEKKQQFFFHQSENIRELK